jgi:hypothetical protein
VEIAHLNSIAKGKALVFYIAITTQQRRHYQKRGLCHAFKSLMCVFYQAHDKERASSKKHGNEYLLCVLFYDARQRIFAVRFNCQSAKIYFSSSALAINGR